MNDETVPQSVLFPDLFERPVTAIFDQAHASTDGGAVLLTAGAYVLLQEVRLRAARTRWARAQVATLRLRLLKLGVQVVTSVRRIVLHLPRDAADRAAWCHIACGLGARPG